jgi:flagellar motor component MotA
MGAGTAIAGIGTGLGLGLIIVGALLSLTGIGALIGIPLIIVGLVSILGGAAGGATVGTAKATFKTMRDITKEQNKRKKPHHKKKANYCSGCGKKLPKSSKFCPKCGEEQ